MLLLGILSSSLWWGNPMLPTQEGLSSSLWGSWLWKESNSFITSGLIWSKLIISASYFFLAFLLNNIMNEFKLIDRPSYIPALCFMLILLLLPQVINFVYLFVCLIFLLTLRLLIASYKTTNPSGILLLMGSLSGLLFLINTIFLLLFVWLSLALLIMRPASWREWIVLTLGFIAPFYFGASYLYLTDSFALSKLFGSLHLEFKLPKLDTISWVKTGMVLVAPWLGLTGANAVINKMMIQGRKAYLTLILLYFIALISCLIQPNQIEHYVYLFLTPCAMLFSPFFSSFKRNFIPNLILLAILSLSLIR